MKGVPWHEISISNEDTSVKIVNTRLYGEGGRSGKHGVWSHKDLEVGMQLKGLHGVLNVGIQTRPWGGRHGTRTDDGLKFLDQGDGKDEGGTCTRHEGLCSGGAQGAMTTDQGNVKGSE